MPTIDWLKKEFHYGYESGDVLAPEPDPVRKEEEDKIGGSYRNVFYKGILPFIRPDSVVMELGPGKGSWSRPILDQIPYGKLYTVDFQDVTKWLQPEKYGGRLICVQVKDNSFSALPDGTFDFFWSMGVLCHQNVEHLQEILTHSLQKMKLGGVAVHQYADWEKLSAYGWDKGKIPKEFITKPDDEIWWPRNSQKIMTMLAERAGWTVLYSDLNLIQRDSMIVLKRMR